MSTQDCPRCGASPREFVDCALIDCPCSTPPATADEAAEFKRMVEDKRPWANPDAPGNALRPDVKCVGCGTMGCVTHWGPWCFTCNVKRMDHLDARFAELEASLTKRPSGADGRGHNEGEVK